MTKYSKLFARYVKKLRVQDNDDQVHGLCPFHDDQTSSWSGNQQTGLFKCHACGAQGNADQFAERIGDTGWILEKRPKPENPWKESTIVDCYDYTDETGKILYQIVRFDPKDFRPRIPNGNGGWETGRDAIKHVNRVLYNLPAIMQAHEVFFVEGEKNARALIERGYVATCIAGGSNGPVTVEMLTVLSKKKLIVIPDNDDPGFAFGQKIINMTSAIADRVYLLRLPNVPKSEDIAWWFQHNHTAEELTKLIEDAPIVGGLNVWEPSLTAYSEYEEKEVDFLWYPYIPLGRITILEGDPGQGKSWFSMALASSASLGTWLDAVDSRRSLMQPSGVIYITSEDDPEDTITKRLRLVQADKTKIFNLTGKAKGNDGAIAITFADLPILANAIRRTSAKLLIIDPIQAYMPNGTDMNKADQVRPIMTRLQQMAREEQCAVLLLRHLSKGTKDNSLYRGMGSIDWTAAARSVLFCGERRELRQMGPTGMRKRVAVAQIKNNIAPFGPTVEFDLAQDEFLWVGVSDVAAEELITSSAMNFVQFKQLRDFIAQNIGEDGTSFETLSAMARKQGLNTNYMENVRVALNIVNREVYGKWRWTLPR